MSHNLFLLPLIFLALFPVVAPRLRQRYYSNTCPDVETTVTFMMQKAMFKEPRSGASVMRFQFHDCFVNGCDASLLLDDTPTMLGEKRSLSNIDSLRSYDVVDWIKGALERICPMTVSCADIIIMASRDAVALSGGPIWQVKLGRLDSLSANQKDSDDIMPSPRANASMLIDLFARFNLSVQDLVALSGSHSIGNARCFSIVHRIYNQSDDGKPDPSIEPGFLKKLQELCPLGGDENVIGDLDFTPRTFDNEYFKDLVNGKGFLNSDETLFTNPQTREYVQRYSEDQSAFLKDFVEGMIKLGDLQSGRPGEIRKNCRVVNSPATTSEFDSPKVKDKRKYFFQV